MTKLFLKNCLNKKINMVFTKIKNLLSPNSYTINSLIKDSVMNRSDTFNRKATCARLDHLAKFRYNKVLTQAQQIILSNLLVHNSETTYQEVPHLVYHTITQKARFQVIPDENVFNLHLQKYGDFINVNTEESIEAKSWNFLSKENLDDIIRQYHKNNRNNKFIFSLFYEKEGNIKESNAIEYFSNILKIESSQIVIKSFDSVVEYCTDNNIEKTIEYYNIPWALYQIENNERLLFYLNELVNSNILSFAQNKTVFRYIKLLTDVKMKKNLKKKQLLKYPYKNNQLLLEDKIHIESNNITLTPEEIMSDQIIIDFNEE